MGRIHEVVCLRVWDELYGVMIYPRYSCTGLQWASGGNRTQEQDNAEQAYSLFQSGKAEKGQTVRQQLNYHTLDSTRFVIGLSTSVHLQYLGYCRYLCLIFGESNNGLGWQRKNAILYLLRPVKIPGGMHLLNCL